jgi:hypothetical protein
MLSKTQFLESLNKAQAKAWELYSAGEDGRLGTLHDCAMEVAYDFNLIIGDERSDPIARAISEHARHRKGDLMDAGALPTVLELMIYTEGAWEYYEARQLAADLAGKRPGQIG